MEENRISKVGELLIQYTEEQKKVQPIISKCLDCMVDHAKKIDCKQVCLFPYIKLFKGPGGGESFQSGPVNSEVTYIPVYFYFTIFLGHTSTH